MAKKSPPPNDDDDDDEDEFTEKQLGTIGKLVNAAVTGTIERKLPAKLKEAITGEMGSLREGIVEDLRKAGFGGGTPAGDKPKEPAAQGQGSPTKDPEVETLRAKVKAMEDQSAAERRAAEARERDGRIEEGLKKIGVEPNRMRGAIAVIRESVKKTEAGHVYKAQRDGYEEDLPLDKGIKEWGDTDEGKAYRAPPAKPAPQVRQGAVNVVGKGGGNGGGSRANADAAQAKSDRKQAGLDKLAGAVNELTGGAAIDMG